MAGLPRQSATPRFRDASSKSTCTIHGGCHICSLLNANPPFSWCQMMINGDRSWISYKKMAVSGFTTFHAWRDNDHEPSCPSKVYPNVEACSDTSHEIQNWQHDPFCSMVGLYVLWNLSCVCGSSACLNPKMPKHALDNPHFQPGS